MKRRKKLLTCLLALAMTTASALAISACDTPDNTATTPPSSIEAVYTQYVEYTSSQGQQPLSYEAWLDSIKGKDGVGISRLEYDNDGNLVVYFTDGRTQTLQAPSLPTVSTETLQYQKIIGKDEYRVVGIGTVSDNEVVIPATYRGLPVTEIAEDAFSQHNVEMFLAKVVLPDSIKIIRRNAFGEDYFITEIVIPDTVEIVENYAVRGDSTIYCKAESKPDGWAENWNSSNCTVVWGYTGE